MSEKSKMDVVHEENPVVPASQSQLRNLNMNNPEDMVRVAKEVAKYVKTNSLSVKIQNRPYVMVEGWQFTAGVLGLVGMIEDSKNDSQYNPITFKWKQKTRNGLIDKEYATKTYKYRAKAVFKNPQTGVVVGQAFAMCTNEEQNKHTFDEYAIESHAQTRAIGKAARMAFSFIIKAAGYEPTPAEEMDGVTEDKGDVVKNAIPNDIVDKIKSFDDNDDLLKWAGSEVMSQFHKNAMFRNLVNAKSKELKNKNDGSK